MNSIKDLARAELAKRAVHEREHDAYAYTDEDRDALTDAALIAHVRGAADYEYAVETVAALKGLAGRIAAWYKPVKDAFNARKNAVLAREHEQLDPVALKDTGHIDRITALAVAWRRDQQAKEAVAKAKIEEEARRLAAEQRDLQERRLVEAAKGQTDTAVQQALLQEARQVAATPIRVPAVNVPSSIPTVPGVAVPKRHKGRVDDFSALVAAVAAGAVPLEALQPNQEFLDNQATALKQNLRYPGVTVVTDESLSVRR